MSRSPATYRLGAIVMVAGGLAGAAISAYGYLTPLTGINGTPGALLVLVSSILIFVAALIAPLVGNRPARNVLRILLALGILGTGVAGLFLHAPALTGAMVVAAIGWIMDCMQPARGARRTEGAIA